MVGGPHVPQLKATQDRFPAHHLFRPRPND